MLYTTSRTRDLDERLVAHQRALATITPDTHTPLSTAFRIPYSTSACAAASRTRPSAPHTHTLPPMRGLWPPHLHPLITTPSQVRALAHKYTNDESRTLQSHLDSKSVATIVNASGWHAHMFKQFVTACGGFDRASWLWTFGPCCFWSVWFCLSSKSTSCYVTIRALRCGSARTAKSFLVLLPPVKGLGVACACMLAVAVGSSYQKMVGALFRRPPSWRYHCHPGR